MSGVIAFDVAPLVLPVAPFVSRSWCTGARAPLSTLLVYLRRPECVSLLAHVPGDPDSMLGWAAVRSGSVVWVYVRDLYGRVRRRGLMTSLLLACGVDVSTPTPCLHWSPAMSQIAGRDGYRLYYAPERYIMRKR